MIDRRTRKLYWQHTKWQMLASLLPYLAVVIVLPLYANKFSASRFLGFPLGFFLAAHGLFFIAVITIAAFVNRQDMIDHWHGTHDET